MTGDKLQLTSNHIFPLQERTNQWTDHQWGLCIFDDVVEYLGPASAKYQEHFVQPILHYLTSAQAEVRQAAAYGCGVLGQHGGPHYAPVCASALPLLMQASRFTFSRLLGNGF